jgi:hypothetical protein
MVGWDERVRAVAHETLTLVRRLAAGASTSERRALRERLTAASVQLRALRTQIPVGVAHREQIVASLGTAAHGAGVEAALLGGDDRMHSDRRAFLAALRVLTGVVAEAEDRTPSVMVLALDDHERAAASTDPTVTVA